MSYRIHRAIGWGMPWEKFETLCQLPSHEYGVDEALDEYFGKLTDIDLTVPDDLYESLFYASGPVRAPIILEKRLLTKNFSNSVRDLANVGRAADLYCLVSTPYKTTDVIFFPNLNYRRKWYRYDNDVDYAFEQWSRECEGRPLGERGSQGAPRDFTIYTGYGHYPWTNNLMLPDGAPTSWDHFSSVERHPEWLPAVPSEIRWYLSKLGILTNKGVNDLRPVIAQWWS